MQAKATEHTGLDDLRPGTRRGDLKQTNKNARYPDQHRKQRLINRHNSAVTLVQNPHDSIFRQKSKPWMMPMGVLPP
jgi:hypothetical protein